MRTFEKIVSEVNESYQYATDQDLYGVPEWWGELKEDDGKLVGDCEDYCISIVNRCVAAGVPLGDLTQHLVATKNKPDHIILECNGWFADCNSRGIMRSPPYKFISHRNLTESGWTKS